jgi:hypothetical protein
VKVPGITSTAILGLLLGMAAPIYAQPVYAQHDQQGEKRDKSETQDHPQQQQSKHEQAKPEQQHAQPQRQPEARRPESQHDQQQQRSNHNKPQEQARQQERTDRPKQPQHAEHRGNEKPRHTQERERVERSSWQQHRSQHWESDHRTWQQRGGYRGYRIPDERFRGYFGPEHGFRVHGLPFLVVGGYPRFQYGGYWVSAVDPWPEYWGDDWYDNDDVYVTYVDNGYYLYNRRYPTSGIAISISF